MGNRLILAATILGLVAAPALAGHNNPWATADDVILEQFHDENQEKSIDTPGEDEMRGVIVQTARGKK